MTNRVFRQACYPSLYTSLHAQTPNDCPPPTFGGVASMVAPREKYDGQTARHSQSTRIDQMISQVPHPN